MHPKLLANVLEWLEGEGKLGCGCEWLEIGNRLRHLENGRNYWLGLKKKHQKDFGNSVAFIISKLILIFKIR